MDYAPVSLCVTLTFMPALLPEGDESAMNFEGLVSLFSTYLSTFSTFLGATLAENVCAQSFESPIPHKKPCRIGPGLCTTSDKAHKAK
jgi:hypothetical protein